MRWIVLLVVGVLTVAILTPRSVEAQISLNVSACKKFEPGVQEGYFSLRYNLCGIQFTIKDAYVGLVAHFRNVQEYTRVTVELLDPDQASVWKIDRTYEVTGGMYYPNIWVWGILPVGADVAAIATENVRLTGNIIKMTDKPAAERPGEWTLRVRADRAGARTMKFMLQAVP